MIIACKCPYRISLLGGGTDIEWFVESEGRGKSIGASISFYSNIFVGYSPNPNYGVLNYSSREEYSEIEIITHPIIRQCLKRFNLDQYIELASFGNVFSGTGLGSSSSFTVALVKAINKMKGVEISNIEAAHIASEIEIKDLQKPIGRQDQYLSALGGVNCFEFLPNGIVKQINYPNINTSVRNYLSNTYLVFTGIKRSATNQLKEQQNAPNSLSELREILSLIDQFIDKSCNLKDVIEIEDLLHNALINSWNIKKCMKGVMNDLLIKIENNLNQYNFKVIKLLGAGGGGYFLVKYLGNDFLKDKSSFINTTSSLIPFQIESQGCLAWEI